MFILIKSKPELKMDHVDSKTRSLGQFLEKECVHSRGHSFNPVFMKLCQNVYLNKAEAKIKNRSCRVKNKAIK